MTSAMVMMVLLTQIMCEREWTHLNPKACVDQVYYCVEKELENRDYYGGENAKIAAAWESCTN